MALATPTVSWEAVLSQVTQDSTQYQYTCKVSKVNVNDPGYGQLAIGYYIVDHIGHIFEIKALNFNGDPEAVVVLDLLSDPYSYGPYNDKNAYVFDSLYKAALLAQAKLGRVDQSAEDFVQSLKITPNWYDVHNYTDGAFRIYGGIITGNVDGTVDVTAGKGMVHTEDGIIEGVAADENSHWISPMKEVFWDAVDNLVLTDDAYNYIYYDYETESIAATTDYYTISFHREFALGRVYRTGTSVVTRTCGTNAWAFDRRVQLFGEERFPVERAKGLMIGNPSGLYISMTEGILWAELVNRFTVAAFDSSGSDTFTYWYRNGSGGWTAVDTQSAIDNLYWDDNTGTLNDLTANRYGVHWVYAVHDSSIHVVYGQGDYTLTLATEATPPSSIPGLLAAYSTLIGKIIVQKSSAVLYSVESPFTTRFSVAGITSHTELADLTTGDSGHTQFPLLAGRVGGQTLVGSPTTNEALTLQGYNKIVRRSSAFDSIWRNTGSTWANFTAAGRSVSYEIFQPLLTNTYKCYFGKITQFSKMYFYFITLAVGQTTTFEYSKGGGVWGALTVTDNTNNFTVNQSAIIFTPPLDWSTDTVNGTSGMYWVRLGSTTSSSTDANIYTVTSDGGETLFEVWHDTAETYPALGVDKNGWASIPYIKTPVSIASTLTVGSTLQCSSYISSNGSYLRSYVASTGTTYAVGIYTYGSTAATVGSPITNSTTIRMLGYAWNTTPTAISKSNGMEMLIKPVSGASTYPVWAFKNAYVDGVVNNTELMWLSHLGDLKTLLSVTSPLYKLEDAGTTAIAKDGSNNMTFTDVVTGTKTLAELAAASSYVYNNATPMPETVGGYEDGTTFTNQSLDEMFDGLLYPYQHPAFNTFTIQSQTTPLEVGASIAANRVFTWTTNLVGDANINAGSIVIRDVTGNANIATGLSYTDTPYTSTYGAITKTTATTNQFSITGTNSKSETFNKTYTVTWQWRRYYGASTSATLDETGIEALTGELASGFAKAAPGYAFSALTNGYKYLCYPAVLGTATSFKDAATGLSVPMESVYTVSVTTNTATPVTTNYNVHRSTNILNDAINIIVA